MATITDAIQKLIVADFTPGIRDALTEEEPTFQKIADEDIGVYQDHIGQDWKVIHTFVTSLAGALKAVSVGGPDIATGTGTGETAVVYSTPRTFPGITEFVSPGYTQKTIQLKQWMGNMYLPQTLLRADRLTASIGSAVSMVIKQTARMVAMIKANLFFTEDQTYKSFAKVKSVTSGGSGTTGSLVFVMADTDRVRRIQPGMLVDVLDASGSYAKLNTDAYLIVRSVDPITRTVSLYTTTGGNCTWGASVAADDVICLKDSRTLGPSGLPSWLVSSGSIFGLNTSYYPAFKSVVKAFGSTTTLDDVNLFTYLGGFFDNFGAAWFPDTLLTTQGVINAYLGNFDDLRRFDASGRSQQVKGGGRALGFDYNGRALEFKASAISEGGYLYGIKLGGGNIRRYVPPRLPNAASNAVFNRDIEFTAPLGGSREIWKHAHYSSNTTEFVEAPFVSTEEYCPEVIPGLKLSNLAELSSVA